MQLDDVRFRRPIQAIAKKTQAIQGVENGSGTALSISWVA